MIIGFDLKYNFNLFRLKQTFSGGYKLLHISWNTLYIKISKHSCPLSLYFSIMIHMTLVLKDNYILVLS